MTGVAFFDIDSLQLEEGVVATEYERPAPAPDGPIEIHSVNNFDVVSQKSEGGAIDGIEVGGRNYVEDSGKERLGPHGYGITNLVITNPSELSNSPAIVSFEAKHNEGNRPIPLHVYYRHRDGTNLGFSYGKNQATTTEYQRFEIPIDSDKMPPNMEGWVHLAIRNGDPADNWSIRNIKLEKGNTATDWTPAPEDITENDNHPLIDKINLSLDEPLRSVDNVKDRLFRDNDGIWKVERNVGGRIVDGSGGFTLEQRLPNSYVQIYMNTGGWNKKVSSSTKGLSDRFLDIRGDVHKGNIPTMGIHTHNGYNVIRFKMSLPFIGMTDSSSNAEILSAFKNWLGNNNTKVIYELADPTIETLDQELQDKLNNLRSFQDSNYVYTIINDKTDIISENLKPTLHAIFKSSGWYNRWKTEDELRKHQSAIDEKANQSDTEAKLNEIASDLLVKQQEIEAAATAGELDSFVKKYNQEQEAFAEEKKVSEEALASAKDAIDLITNKMDNMSETWEFFDEYIKFEEGSIVLGNETEGSHVRIHNDRISFYSNGYEVASITQGKMTIEAGTFVEEIQISEFKFQKSSNGHLTVRYVG